jgi:hypothetical protein
VPDIKAGCNVGSEFDGVSACSRGSVSVASATTGIANQDTEPANKHKKPNLPTTAGLFLFTVKSSQKNF